MIKILRCSAGLLLLLLTALLSPSLQAAPAAAEIGVVVMHGKGGQPRRFVIELATAFERAGYQVANLEMPWSGRRQYDVDMNAATEEVTRAIEAMRAKGARKVFVSGHSQGGVFAVYYGRLQRVDGIVTVAPGGQVDTSVFAATVAHHVAKARQMVESGRGGEKSEFGDFEGTRGTSAVNTTAAIYLSWFDPNGGQTTRAFRNVKEGTPVLYVAPLRDYPALQRGKLQNFSALPSHAQTRLYEPDSDHLNSPAAAAKEAVAWVRQVADQ